MCFYPFILGCQLVLLNHFRLITFLIVRTRIFFFSLEGKVPDSPESCPRGVLEQAVCHRLCTVVAALHELSQSALPEGPCTEATLKVSSLSLFSSNSVFFFLQKMIAQIVTLFAHKRK